MKNYRNIDKLNQVKQTKCFTIILYLNIDIEKSIIFHLNCNLKNKMVSLINHC